jgi:Icc-related predicted phosphoesterase
MRDGSLWYANDGSIPLIIRALSDQHGNLPKVELCDLLLIAGDLCPIDNHDHHHQRNWLRGEFSDWLEGLEAKHIIGIAGNHDFVLEKQPGIGHELPWTYLCDSSAEVEGLRVFGMPWVPNLPNWAFHAPDDMLGKKVDAIPDNTDILVTHGPPYGVGDTVWGSHVGSSSLASAISYRLDPTLHVFGHIHEGHGRWHMQEMTLANVALVDEFYDMTRVPMGFEVDKP